MNYWKFLLYTTLGAGVWHSILAAMGWYLSSVVSKDELNSTIERYNHYIVTGIIAVVAIAIAFFVIRHYMKKKANGKNVNPSSEEQER